MEIQQSLKEIQYNSLKHKGLRIDPKDLETVFNADGSTQGSEKLAQYIRRLDPSDQVEVHIPYSLFTTSLRERVLSILFLRIRMAFCTKAASDEIIGRFYAIIDRSYKAVCTDEQHYYIMLVLNTSRALIDFSSDDAVFNMLSILGQGLGVSIYRPDLPFKLLMAKAKSVLCRLTSSLLFRRSLIKFTKHYGIQISISKARELFTRIRKVLVLNSGLCGMVGIDSIYIDVSEILPTKSLSDRLLALINAILHETAHFLFRFARNDYALLSPKGRGYEESGYFFVKTLTGFPICRFITELLDGSRWSRKELLHDDEKQKYTEKIKGYKFNSVVSGLCKYSAV